MPRGTAAAGSRFCWVWQAGKNETGQVLVVGGRGRGDANTSSTTTARCQPGTFTVHVVALSPRPIAFVLAYLLTRTPYGYLGNITIQLTMGWITYMSPDTYVVLELRGFVSARSPAS